MAKVLKVGVIGAGAAARLVHLPALDRVPEAEVLVIADTHLERAEALARRHGIPIVTPDLHALLRREEVDAVCLCTPPACHAEQIAAAIEAGKHVLCEMPLVLDPMQGA
ncbi:MAG: Gfo/Idh/MocA family oxidoreductase, partial [Armatimonadota bacterium]|nr:Gfo/Idh/MocA family oxidoreductase [Armatimonadota bacterium]